jgi:hypothetical protein
MLITFEKKSWKNKSLNSRSIGFVMYRQTYVIHFKKKAIILTITFSTFILRQFYVLLIIINLIVLKGGCPSKPVFLLHLWYIVFKGGCPSKLVFCRNTGFDGQPPLKTMYHKSSRNTGFDGQPPLRTMYHKCSKNTGFDGQPPLRTMYHKCTRKTGFDGQPPLKTMYHKCSYNT